MSKEGEFSKELDNFDFFDNLKANYISKINVRNIINKAKAEFPKLQSFTEDDVTFFLYDHTEITSWRKKWFDDSEAVAAVTP